MDNYTEQYYSPSREYRIYVTSHKGLIREKNEDNFTVNFISKRRKNNNVAFTADSRDPLLVAVFDGMGGESNGDYASCVSAKLCKGLFSRIRELPSSAMDSEVEAFATKANNVIRDFVSSTGCKCSGSTMAMTAAVDGIFYTYSVGDSRVYLFNDSHLTQITRDHTLAEEKYQNHIISYEEAQSSAESHMLTYFLGSDYEKRGLRPQKYEPIELQVGEKLLMCSDGLYDECTRIEMENIIKGTCDNPSFELVRAALKHGGDDNVTAIVVERIH